MRRARTFCLCRWKRFLHAWRQGYGVVWCERIKYDTGVCKIGACPRSMIKRKSWIAKWWWIQESWRNKPNKVSAPTWSSVPLFQHTLRVWHEVLATEFGDNLPTACVQSVRLLCKYRYDMILYDMIQYVILSYIITVLHYNTLYYAIPWYSIM